jgi:hypothetical protein
MASDTNLLWVLHRRQENSYRFMGDVLLGLTRQLKAVNPDFVAPPGSQPVVIDDPLPPKPPCFPGMPCQRELRYVRDVADRMARDAATIRDCLEVLLDKAEELRIKHVIFEATQFPVNPDGSKAPGGGESRVPAGREEPR